MSNPSYPALPALNENSRDSTKSFSLGSEELFDMDDTATQALDVKGLEQVSNQRKELPKPLYKGRTKKDGDGSSDGLPVTLKSRLSAPSDDSTPSSLSSQTSSSQGSQRTRSTPSSPAPTSPASQPSPKSSSGGLNRVVSGAAIKSSLESRTEDLRARPQKHQLPANMNTSSPLLPGSNAKPLEERKSPRPPPRRKAEPPTRKSANNAEEKKSPRPPVEEKKPEDRSQSPRMEVRPQQIEERSPRTETRPQQIEDRSQSPRVNSQRGLSPARPKKNPVSMSRLESEPKGSRLSHQLSSKIANPSKFRTAHNSEGYLAGWVMLKNQKGVWKRKFLDLGVGEISVFSTDPPTNCLLKSSCDYGVSFRMESEEGVIMVSEDDKKLFYVKASNRFVGTLVKLMMAVKLGDETEEMRDMTTVTMIDEEQESESADDLMERAQELRRNAQTADEFQRALGK